VAEEGVPAKVDGNANGPNAVLTRLFVRIERAGA
jgi:hypothetical protein